MVIRRLAVGGEGWVFAGVTGVDVDGRGVAVTVAGGRNIDVRVGVGDIVTGVLEGGLVAVGELTRVGSGVFVPAGVLVGGGRRVWKTAPGVA
jgi:hypothetical protein